MPATPRKPSSPTSDGRSSPKWSECSAEERKASLLDHLKAYRADPERYRPATGKRMTGGGMLAMGD